MYYNSNNGFGNACFDIKQIVTKATQPNTNTNANANTEYMTRPNKWEDCILIIQV